MNNLNILLLVVSSYIVGFKKPSLLLHHINRLCVILDIKPVTHIFAVAVAMLTEVSKIRKYLYKQTFSERL